MYQHPPAIPQADGRLEPTRKTESACSQSHRYARSLSSRLLQDFLEVDFITPSCLPSKPSVSIYKDYTLMDHDSLEVSGLKCAF